ncbi:MAG: PAS domain S-box protein [Phycisphaerales bacterium]|nr:PAS domain S-box protein [Phycisphaerales bacterium]
MGAGRVSGRRGCGVGMWWRAVAAAAMVVACAGWAPEDRVGVVREARPSWEVSSGRSAGSKVIVGVADRWSARGLVEDEGPAEPKGFAVEVAREALGAVGLVPEFRSLARRDAVRALERGEVELVTPLSVTDERLDRLDYTMPIVLCRGAIVSRRGVPVVSRMEDLRGRRVVTASAGVGDLWCTQHGVEHERGGNLADALMAVSQGRADYAVSLEMASRWEIRSSGIGGLVVTALPGTEHTRSFAMATGPDDEALSNSLNRGLSILRESGRFDELYQQWAARYQPTERAPMVRESTLLWVAGTALGLLSAAALVQLGLYRRLSARTRLVREREAEYRAVTEALPALVFSYFRGDDGRSEARFANSKLAEWKRLFPSIAPGEPYQETILKDIHPDDVRHYEMETERARQTRSKFDVEFRLRSADGSYRWVHTTLNPLPAPGGLLWQGLMLDVTDLRCVQEALRVSEERARLLLDNVGVIAWEAEAGSLDLSYVSGRAETLTGYSVAEWLSPNFWGSHIHEDDRDWAMRLCQEATARGESHEFEYRFVARGGRVLRLRDIVTIEMREGRPVRLRGVMVDVTALRESQEALAASEKRFRSMIENSHGGVMMMGADGRVVYDNGGLDRLLGYSAGELVGRPANDVVHPEDLPAVVAHDAEVAAMPGGHRSIEFRAAHRNGSWRWIETVDTNHLDEPAIGAIVCNYRDITERKETEEARRRLDQEVMQTQKLESLGVLVGGVAHDFNNLLTGIVGNAALARRIIAEDDPARGCVQQIEAAAARAADLTRNMLAYAGKGRISPRPVDLGSLLRDTLTLVTGSLSRTATVRVTCDMGLPAAECDPAQISQVMMNLVLNASDAIGERAGTIRVKISQESPGPADRRDAFPGGWEGRGPMLCLEVSDNGCGMTADIRARIFDPFFTTKFAGRGLGLAATLGIVRGHGGAISVRSRPGEGSMFRVWLPCAREGAVEERPGPADLGGARGTVLVVDDEPLVLNLVGQALETAGFRVMKASSGPEAIGMLEGEAGPGVDGVLLDLTMPEMDGEAVLRRMREMRPGLPVVLMSGYSEGDVLNRLAGVETKSFLQKPFKIEDLIATARGLVGGERANGNMANSK